LVKKVAAIDYLIKLNINYRLVTEFEIGISYFKNMDLSILQFNNEKHKQKTIHSIKNTVSKSSIKNMHKILINQILN
jgi:hypothetical protein